MTYNSASGPWLVAAITSSSSKLLSWGRWIWKAKMTLFNFDVHHLHWFILDHNEKRPWSWNKKSAKTNKCRIFLSIKVHFAISLIFKDLQLKNHEKLNSNHVETFEVHSLIYHLSIGSVILVAWAASYDPPKWGTWLLLALFH